MTNKTDLPEPEAGPQVGAVEAHLLTAQPAGVAARAAARQRALESALMKRSHGVPTYTVPEAAALLSISPEALYRLVRCEDFPAVRVGQKYSVPAAAVADLLESGTSMDITDWGVEWKSRHRRAGDGAA